MYKSFLIKYGEIAVKGKNRHLFEDALVRQINYALKPVDGKFTVIKQQGLVFYILEVLYDCGVLAFCDFACEGVVHEVSE